MVTKLSPARWRVIFDGEVPLSPSIAATGLPCNAHYFITRGQVDWHRELNAEQAAQAREADQQAVRDYRVAITQRGRMRQLSWRFRRPS